MQNALHINMLLYFFGFVIILFVILRDYKKISFLNYFALYFLCNLSGVFGMYYQDSLPQFIGVVIANLVLLLGATFLLHGVVLFYKKKRPYIFVLSVVLVYFLSFLYFTYSDNNVSIRIIIHGLGLITIYGYILYLLIMESIKVTKIFDLFEFVLGLLIIAHVYRIVYLLIINESYSSFLDYTFDAMNVIILGICGFMISAGILAIINNKLINTIVENDRSRKNLHDNLPGFAYRRKHDNNWTMEIITGTFQQITGYQIADVIENDIISFNDIILEEFQDEAFEKWESCIRDNKKFTGEYKIRRKNGDIVWIWEQGQAIRDINNNVVALEGFITNIDIKKDLEENLEFLSYRDALTGLYNRRFIEEEISRVDVVRNLPISVIVGDLNGLKFINDSLGHKYGDNLLIEIAKIFEKVLRNDELISRQGGDEFLILLPNTSIEDAALILSRLNDEIAASSKETIGLSISLGAATKEVEFQELRETIKTAESNMYNYKINNRPINRMLSVDSIINALYRKDRLCETHSRNVAFYSQHLAKAAKLSEKQIKDIETAGLLHDIGKITLDDVIIQKDGPLELNEYEEIKKHPEAGYRILINVIDYEDIARMILSHHERIDGNGYPHGIKADKIPLESKILAICDAYDAMTGETRYREPFTVGHAKNELKQHTGKQFDRKLVNIFINEVLNNLEK